MHITGYGCPLPNGLRCSLVFQSFDDDAHEFFFGELHAGFGRLVSGFSVFSDAHFHESVDAEEVEVVF